MIKSHVSPVAGADKKLKGIITNSSFFNTLTTLTNQHVIKHDTDEKKFVEEDISFSIPLFLRNTFSYN